MRILIAPDDFKGTLTAAEAAHAIASGWARTRPGNALRLRPISDGGPGFVTSLAVSLGVELRVTSTVDAYQRPIAAHWCRAGDTAYIEAAQVVGLHLGADVGRASSRGLADLLLAARAAGAATAVVGLGGTCVNDAGAGLFAGLGVTAEDCAGVAVTLDAGPLGLGRVATIDCAAAVAQLAGLRLIVATDVDVPLLGPRGATYGFAQQKGASESDLASMETALAEFASACGRRADGRDPAVALGAGAAGGLGFALMRLGAERVPGIDLVLDASDLDLPAVDLVVTGEGALDWQSMRGKAISGIAKRALARGIPVVAIAGRVEISARERSEMGLDAAYSVSELIGAEAALTDPANSLAAAAGRVARTWG